MPDFFDKMRWTVCWNKQPMDGTSVSQSLYCYDNSGNLVRQRVKLSDAPVRYRVMEYVKDNPSKKGKTQLEKYVSNKWHKKETVTLKKAEN